MPELAAFFYSPGEICGLICFDLSRLCTKLAHSAHTLMPLTVVFRLKNRWLLALWVCGRETRECGQLVGRAMTDVAACTGPFARSMGCPHIFSSGRSAARGLVHISIGRSQFVSSALAQGTSSRVRRWIMLRCVDWVPPDFTASRSLPFSSIRGHRPGTPFGLSRPTPV